MISLTALEMMRVATGSFLFGSQTAFVSNSTSFTGGSAEASSSAEPDPGPLEARLAEGGPHGPLAVIVGTETSGQRLAAMLCNAENALCAEQVRVESVIGLTLPQDVTPLDEAIGRIARGELDWLVLLSRNAAVFLHERCAALEVTPETVAQLKIACVGAGTAEAAEALGLRVSWVPSHATGACFVEEALETGLFRGQRVLAPRSAIGDDEMLEPLRQQVTELHLVSAYENCPQPINEAAWLKYAHREPGPVVAFLSSSAVTALWSGLALTVQEQLARNARLLAIGPSTAETMQQVHWPAKQIADPPGLEALAELLRQELGQG